MKERPILFSGPMVRAILRDLDPKTQTRRALGELPFPFSEPEFDEGNVIEWLTTVRAGEDAPDPDAVLPAGWFVHNEDSEDDGCHPIRCPYGQPGDRLWVRETWRVGAWREDGRLACDYAASPEITNTPWADRTKFKPMEFAHLVGQSQQDCRKAGLKEVNGAFHWDAGRGPCRWRPSIHMPRWASRITLEVTEVRAQRLQDITWQDVLAEGWENGNGFWRYPGRTSNQFKTAQEAFGFGWDSINGRRQGCAWKENPRVWAVSFKRLP